VTPLLKDLMNHSYITIKSVSSERQRKMIDQLLLGRPDFYTTVKDVMTDESTFNLPKPAQDLIS